MTPRLTSVHANTDRLIAERLNALAAAACAADDRPFLRLVAAALHLREQHRIDATGRCRICKRRRIRPSRARPCTVHTALGFFLTQPDELVQPELPHPVTDAERTTPLPRLTVSTPS